MEKKKLERRLNKSIDKALFALSGMLHIPTAEAIKFYFLNPRKKPNN
jgi:hypothetical protein